MVGRHTRNPHPRGHHSRYGGYNSELEIGPRSYLKLWEGKMHLLLLILLIATFVLAVIGIALWLDDRHFRRVHPDFDEECSQSDDRLTAQGQ